MATVLIDRGNTSKLDNTPLTNGLIYFNTDDKCIYVDNEQTRDAFGGNVQRINTPVGATNNNILSALGTVTYFCQKTDVLDTSNSINTNSQANRPVGGLGFKAIVGTDDISPVGNTVKHAIAKLGDRLSVNNNKFVFDYQDGKWGFNTSEERGADTFHPFNSTLLSIFTSSDYNTNQDIDASNINLNISATTLSNATNIPLNFLRGSAVVTYWSEARQSVGYGDVIHLFDDQNGSGDSNYGTHEHYVFDSSWHKSTTAPSPLKTIESGADLGLPFVIKKLVNYNTDYYKRMDDLYFYTCANNIVKIYKYNISNTNAWSGTWSEISSARLELASYDSNKSHYKIGSRKSIVVYNNELHILGGTYVQDGNTVTDTRHFVWNPQTNTWRVMGELSIPIDYLYGVVTHNNKIYAFVKESANPSPQCYTYDGFNWSEATDIVGLGTDYDNGTSFVEYNGEIHWIGGTLNNPKIHAKLVDTKRSGYDSYQTAVYPNINYNFKEGVALVSQPFTTTSNFRANVDDTNVDNTPKFIHLLGTSQANTESASYRKYHRTLQDTYKASIYNEKDYIEVTV